MKLNIGGGFTYCDNFRNVDICKEYLVWWFPAKQLLYKLSGTHKYHSFEKFKKVLESKPIHHDVRKPLPFKSKSVDEIYTSHLLEHLKFWDGVIFLHYCLYCLRPSGVLRIVTPDFDIVDKTVLFNEFSDEWSRHKWVWSFSEIKAIFPSAVKLKQFEGDSTAKVLDSMPEQSMYIEIIKDEKC